MAEPTGSFRRDAMLLSALSMFALAWWLVLLRFTPSPARSDAREDAFGAMRAIDVLRELLGDQRPHPVGSAANRAVRARIELQLGRLGLVPLVRKDTGCGYGQCAAIENVVVVIAGARPEEGAVMVAAHYDSVPRGPGAADDGAGVAVLLEIARALGKSPKLDRDVVLLFDDGEEAGLLGADAFMRRDPLASRVKAVINVEARGTSGPSLMFETKRARLPHIRAMARALDRPATSSLFSAVYERMPNDTDLTVFGRHGLLGFNFAFIRELENYHTAKDDLAHLSLDSVQHHGDNALALLRALADARLPIDSADGPRAVWFDWLGATVIVWPEPWSLALALVAFSLCLVAVVRMARREKRWSIGVAACAGATIVSWILAAALGAGFVECWRAAAGGARVWLAHPDWGVPGGQAWPGLTALWGAALLGVSAAAAIARRFGAWSRCGGVWLLWSAIAVAMAVVFNAGSYLFIVPTLFAGVAMAAAGSLARAEKRGGWALIMMPAFFAGTIWFGVVAGLRDALSLDGHAALALSMALPLSTGLPLLAEIHGRARWVPPIAGAVCMATGVIGAIAM